MKITPIQYLFRLCLTLLILLLLTPCKYANSLTFPTKQLKSIPISQPIYVTHLEDNGTGSLRWAIEQANQTPEDDCIDLSRVSGTILLHSSLPAINSNVFLIGDGNDIINGDRAHRVLSVKQGDVTIHNLTIQDGLAKGVNGQNGAGGAAGMGGGLLIETGTVIVSDVSFVGNQAIGGDGTDRTSAIPARINSSKQNFEVNRGAVIGINGVSNLTNPDLDRSITLDSDSNRFRANRGAIAGVNGIGIGGIGTIAFGGGGGFGGFGNAGNGGNGGNGGTNGGSGGNGGDGGDGGVGIFGSFGQWDRAGIGAIAFGGGGGFGGFGNAGNGGNGGNAIEPTANGGNGGNGGFGGGGGSGGNGGAAGTPGKAGKPGVGGFGGGNGGLGRGGGGAGFGGAIFVRSGCLILSNTKFEQNAAIGGSGANPGQGDGAAVFASPKSLSPQAGVSTVAKIISLKQRQRHF